MSATAAGLLQVALVVIALAVVHRPLGDYMARVFTSPKHLSVERWTYRVAGVNAEADQRWSVYVRSVLAFTAVGVVALYAMFRLQALLPLSLDRPTPSPEGAWNTAVSFVTNTNWQWYSGESAMGHLVQMAGLTVQNFLSAAVGLSVAVAVIRGFQRTGTDRLGNFWVDLVRATVRILLPLSFIAAVLLMAGGAVQNFVGDTTIQTLSGGSQTIVGGPIASQEAIKEIGTNGGGFFNANSSHPFENPAGWTNLLQIFLLLLIPFSLPRTFGRMVGSLRQGYAIVAAMAVIFTVMTSIVIAAEVRASGVALEAAGAAMEGKEQRFGVVTSALFASATTSTSTGSVNSFHDSYTATGGGGLIVNMLLGEISPGGVGSGLYGMLVIAVLAVFLSGLMVGRTPEFLGKKIGAREIKLAALYVLVMPALVLVGVGLSLATQAGQSAIQDPGAHGLSEVLYAWASASNNNGSAFAGLGVNTPFYNVGLGIAMLLGRLLPIVLALALAGSFARQGRAPATSGTLPTAGPLFVGLLVGTAVVLSGLTFLPALALGPIAEALS